MSTREFWAWFRSNRDALRTLRGDAAVTRIEERIATYDSRLGVEISDSESPRELIITAGGDPTVFEVAEQLVTDAPCFEEWKFHALKQPQGFDFTITHGQLKVDAAGLMFQPIKSSGSPELLGIRVHVPKVKTFPSGFEALINLVVQTGVGEKAAAAVSRIEVVHLEADAKDILPIQRLAQYIGWFLERQSRSK